MHWAVDPDEAEVMCLQFAGERSRQASDPVGRKSPVHRVNGHDDTHQDVKLVLHADSLAVVNSRLSLVEKSPCK